MKIVIALTDDNNKTIKAVTRDLDNVVTKRVTDALQFRYQMPDETEKDTAGQTVVVKKHDMDAFLQWADNAITDLRGIVQNHEASLPPVNGNKLL